MSNCISYLSLLDNSNETGTTFELLILVSFSLELLDTIISSFAEIYLALATAENPSN